MTVDLLSRQRPGLGAHVPQKRSGTLRCRTLSASEEPDSTTETRVTRMRMVFSRSRQRATLPRMTSQVPARKTVWDFPGRAFNYLNVPYLCSMAFHCRVRGSNRATVPLCSVSPLLLTEQA